MRQTASPDIQIEVPQTREQLNALGSLREELQHQLAAAVQLRVELNSGAVVSTDRIKAVEDRMGNLQAKIQQADDAMAAALARGVGNMRYTTQPPMPRPTSAETIAQAVGIESFLILIAVAIWRFTARRSRPGQQSVEDQSGRLEQLQGAVDVIAVEVERISEAQRYVTKLLNEKLQPGIGAGDAQPIPVKKPADAVRPVNTPR